MGDGVRRVRAGGLVAAGGVAALLLAASGAWGCASIASLEFASPRVQAGQEVAFKVVFVHKDRPVTVHWGALDGPVVATVTPDKFTEGLHGNWRFAPGSLTVPAGTRAGTHILVANQEAHRDTALWGMPARGALEVVGETGAVPATVAPAVSDRPTTLVTGDDSPDLGKLALVGLGAGGVAMFLAGLAIAIGGRRAARPAPEPAAAGGER